MYAAAATSFALVTPRPTRKRLHSMHRTPRMCLRFSSGGIALNPRT